MYDNILQQQIVAELAFEPSIDPAEIGVAVRDGIVTLTGSVDSYAQKLAAEKAAKRVRGVLAVAEEIEVKLPPALIRTDADVARAVLNALEWDVQVPSGKIQVKVENGWVTLEGEVSWEFQKRSATEAVRHLTGVRGVSNLIDVKPRVETQEIKDEIGQAFKRNADLDANRVRVDAAVRRGPLLVRARRGGPRRLGGARRIEGGRSDQGLGRRVGDSLVR